MMENRADGPPEDRAVRSCPLSVVLVSWGLMFQGIALMVVLAVFVFCACDHVTEVADEFSGVVILLLLAAGLVLLIGVKLLRGSAWTRAAVLWGGAVPVLDGFIEGTRAPALLVLLAAQYAVCLYVLTKPEVLPCFRGRH